MIDSLVSTKVAAGWIEKLGKALLNISGKKKEEISKVADELLVKPNVVIHITDEN